MDKDLQLMLITILIAIAILTSAILYSAQNKLNRGMIYVPAHWEVINANRK